VSDGSIAQLNDALAGRYSVEREVGAGGMATVYLARDLRHDRPVAIKVLATDLSASLAGARFLQEILGATARAAAASGRSARMVDTRACSFGSTIHRGRPTGPISPLMASGSTSRSTAGRATSGLRRWPGPS